MGGGSSGRVAADDPPVDVVRLVAEADSDTIVNGLLVAEGLEGLEVPGHDLGVDGLGDDDAGVSFRPYKLPTVMKVRVTMARDSRDCHLSRQ